jgi:hypothetical protein
LAKEGQIMILNTHNINVFNNTIRVVIPVEKTEATTTTMSILLPMGGKAEEDIEFMTAEEGTQVLLLMTVRSLLLMAILILGLS